MAPSKKKPQLPFISVCTPTFNRRPFIENMFECFRNQTYPKNRIEWIIVDDGTDKIKDLVESSNIPQIRYFEVNEKMSLGAKRNYMHKFVRGTIIVYMDDDDYYPPERIEDAVEKLQANPQALAAGSSEIYIYFKHIKKMYKCGPYNPNHATAGTFAFRTDLLKITKYEETAAVAEERAFLKDYTIPFVQLDPMKAILVFSHNHNTFDKRKMLDNPHPDFFRECDKTVEMFIRKTSEKKIYDFFMRDIDGLLENYEPGEPKMKPDVLIQIKEIEAKRDQMVKDEMAKMQGGGGQIMLQQPGQPPTALNNQQVVELIQQQQQNIQQLSQKCEEFNSSVAMLQKQLIEKTRTIRELSSKSLNDTGIMEKNTLLVGETTNDITVTESYIENSSKINDLEAIIITLQKQLIEKTKTIRELSEKPITNDNNELQNMVVMLQKQLIEKTKALRDIVKTVPQAPANNTENMQNMINMLQSQLVEKSNSIRDLNSKVISSNNDHSVLNNKVNEMEKMIAMQKSQLASFDNLNNNLISSNNDNYVLTNKVNEMETLITNLQKQLIDKNIELQKSQPQPPSFTRIPIIEDEEPVTVKSKSDPEITVSAED